ncbi:MAG: efflux RND transporter periplasmic adaptor subunit [Polyangiaceae bacterium]|nr:efflux RND transporter periplasmic adaptor subunit [Polyangiaceae bacterium]
MAEITPTGASGLAADAAADLSRELARHQGRRWLRRVVWLGLLVGVVAALWFWRRSAAPPPEPRFSVEKTERRDVLEQVQSTGTVKPLTEVQVGAQVSGRVVKVGVDFNSVVKKGDLLAEIDPSLFGAQVSQTSAQLKAARASEQRARARLATSKTALDRLERLAKEGIASPADVDQARGERDVAEADLLSAQAQIGQFNAQLSSARTTLAYARIYSPIDGVVIDRQIEPGQTVAASFAAPVMFVIAKDLSEMQVMAEIDEADVGKLAEAMKAEVVVDAFPGESFGGKVTQIRYAPNNVQGVVTYSAVIEVKNPELKLRPGMTATVTVTTREARGVLAVRNAALRFRPLPERDDQGKPKPSPPPPPVKHGQGRLYVVTGGERGQETAEPRVVAVGFSDGVWTVLTGSDLSEGAEVVTEQRESKTTKRFGLF